MSAGINLKLAFILFPLLINSAKAIGYHELWTRTNSDLRGNQFMEIDPKGDLFYLSSSADATNTVLAKYAGKTGTLVWQHDLPLTSHQFALDPEGDPCIATGFTNGTARIAKFSGETGRILWEQINDANFGRHFIVSENSVFTMDVRAAQTKFYWQIKKFSSDDGALLWEKHIPEVDAGGTTIAVGKNGDVVVGGIKDANYHVIKLAASDGSIIWTHQSPQTAQTNSFQRICSIATDTPGNVTFLAALGQTNLHLESLSGDNGNLKWSASHPDEKDWSAHPQIVVALDDGDVITETTVYWFVAPGSGHAGACVARYRAADGALVWKRRFEPVSTAHGVAPRPSWIVRDSDNNIILATTSYGRFEETRAYKINAATGDIIWETEHPGTFIDVFAYSKGRLAFSGNPKLNTIVSVSRIVRPIKNPKTIAMFQIAPELQGRIVDDQFELSWHPEHIGFQLEISAGLTSPHWIAIPDTTATNRIRLNQSESTGLFRLVRD